MALDYDYLSTVAREKIVPKLIDNIYDMSATLKILLLDGRVKEYLDGGTSIHETILYEKMSASGTYSGWDTVDITPPDNLTKSVHSWANYYATVGINGDDEDKIGGSDTRVINLLNQRMQEAETKMKDDLSADLFEGGGGNALVGFDTAVGAGSYGGIDGAVYTWWASGTSATAHTEAQLSDPTDTTHYIKRLFRAAERSCLHKNMVPNLIVTTPLIYDIYEETLETDARYLKTDRGKKIADGGFDVLEWRSKPVVKDELCPAGYVFFMNTEFIKIYTHPSAYFGFTGFKQSTNQVRARVGQVYTKLQLVLNNRRMHYKFTGFPTT